ncbi:MAG TPA: ROK family protein, partial [Verrucomicrobiae bacterium]|nr:ROK family protein [Verrucomicrobiae bacterium]
TGMAGEWGHVTLQENGPLCKCGNRGCWEACASNSAAVRYFTESEPTQNKPKMSGMPTFDLVLKLAQQGQPQAHAALEKMAHYLGVGVAMTIAALAPDVLVVVGEVTRVWDKVGPIIDGVITSRLSMGSKTQIVPTNPDTQPRLRGTIALVLQKHFGVPHLA